MQGEHNITQRGGSRPGSATTPGPVGGGSGQGIQALSPPHPIPCSSVPPWEPTGEEGHAAPPHCLGKGRPQAQRPPLPDHRPCGGETPMCIPPLSRHRLIVWPIDVPSEGTESRRAAGPGGRAGSPRGPSTSVSPPEGLPRERGGGGPPQQAGRRSAAGVPPPRPHPRWQQNARFVRLTRPIVQPQHPGGGRAALTMLSLARPPAPRPRTCVFTFAHTCVPGHPGRAR